MAVERIALTLSIGGGIAGFGPAPNIAASLFLPPDGGRPRALAFCLHGGGYSRRYFDIEALGQAGYSMARYMADRGVAVATIDCLGGGDSSRAESANAIVWQTLAPAHHAALLHLRSCLAAGAVLPMLPAVPTVGIGHSLGGMLFALHQATERSFDKLAALGWSNLGLNLPPEALVPIPDATGEYFRSSPALRRQFHLNDVPADILESEAEQENLGVAASLAAQAADSAAAAEISGTKDGSQEMWK